MLQGRVPAATAGPLHPCVSAPACAPRHAPLPQRRLIRVASYSEGQWPSNSTFRLPEQPPAPSSSINPGTPQSNGDGSGKKKKKRVTRRFSQQDYELLPHRIVLIRHAESMGNVEKDTYCTNPDHMVVLTDNGRKQALKAGEELCETLQQVHGDDDFSVFFMTSPYSRTIETTDMLLEAFSEEQVLGVRSAVQLREQDFGNFQDPQRINQDMNDRLKFGRFWFRFPNGESGADVYDRITIFEDHLTRDMLMGRFNDTSLVLVTHGLTLRVFLMRWFHWSVEEMLRIFNPGNCVPVTLEKLPWDVISDLQTQRYVGVKQCFAITPQSIVQLQGCTRSMASYLPRNLKDYSAKASWKKTREPKDESLPAAPDMEVSGNWLYGYYCSVPEPTMQHSSWANTGEGDIALQSEDEAAGWLNEVNMRSDPGAGSRNAE